MGEKSIIYAGTFLTNNERITCIIYRKWSLFEPLELKKKILLN